MLILRRLALAAAAAIGTVALAAAPAQAAPSAQDTQFLQAAHQSNLAEIAVGRLAQQRAASQTVRDLGAKFVADHTQLDQSLQQVATALGVTLPAAPNPSQQRVAAQLEAAAGGEFDRLFVSTQLAAHMAAMRLGETELAKGQDAQAKKVASDAAPVIKSHHEALHAAASALGVPHEVNGGTGGRATPHRPYGVAGVLIAGGLLLVAGGGWYRRRVRTAA